MGFSFYMDSQKNNVKRRRSKISLGKKTENITGRIGELRFS